MQLTEEPQQQNCKLRKPHLKACVATILALCIALAFISNSKNISRRSSESVSEKISRHSVPANLHGSIPANDSAVPVYKIGANRTLVVIIGNLRGGELAWQTLYKHVLDKNIADLALAIGEVPVEQRNSSLYARAKYLWEFPEYDDWADAIDLINGTKWRDELLPHVHKGTGLLGGVSGRAGSGAVVFMARWFLSEQIKKLGLLEKYDRFLVTRSDHYYECAHDLAMLDPTFMWVPKFTDYDGVTDRHVVCNNRQILRALDILPHMIEHPELYIANLKRRINAEGLVLKRWEMENLVPKLRKFDRTFFTCASDGDKTRWQQPTDYTVEEGVHLKYVVEYEAAKCACRGWHPRAVNRETISCWK